ncbi:MAG TPA: DUF1028 domain-containing protein [Alkalispirochaeta sp.]|nr:DUF1028 domain-containing protein [Alkalispirochaeta sp.]
MNGAPLLETARQATFSIAAVDARHGVAGCATASRYVAVASLVLHAAADAGVVITQSVADRNHGVRGLQLLADGASPHHVLHTILADDDRTPLRQVAVMDSRGAAAHVSGAQCTPIVAAHEDSGVVALGNMLASDEVPAAMVAAYHRVYSAAGPVSPQRRRAHSMAEALIAALRAGEAAGGDRRGKQAAGILVVAAGAGYGGRDDRAVDLRVDDHPAPVDELNRIFGVFVENQHREFEK